MIFCLVRSSSSRGRLKDLRRPALHLGVQLVRRHDRRDQTQRERLRGADRPAGERELARHRAADELVERAVDDVAEGDLGVREGRGRGGDPEVAEDREIESSRERRAVDGGDRRQRAGEHRVVEAVARVPEPPGVLGVAELAELLQVEAGGEDVAGAGDHDRLDGRVAPERVDRVAHLVAEGDRQGVLLLGARQRDRRDARRRRR